MQPGRRLARCKEENEARPSRARQVKGAAASLRQYRKRVMANSEIVVFFGGFARTIWNTMLSRSAIPKSTILVAARLVLFKNPSSQ